MTELIWDGKYKDGKKVAPVKIALPFQTIETINESVQQRQFALDFSVQEPGAAYGEWRNRLIWGDKKYVLPSLLPEFAGKVNLIYIDPPFNVGADFSFTATIPDNPETDEDENTQFVKQPSIIEQKAYRDTWGKGLDSYMQWFYETAILLKELLAENGSIYVHLDWHIGHYAKIILDEVFGYDNFRNEIIWHYSGWNKKLINSFEKRHDVLYYYSKNETPTFNSYFEKWNSKEEYIKKRKQKPLIDELTGREYVLSDGGNGLRVKRFIEDAIKEGVVVDDVWHLDKLNNSAKESVYYPTQKVELLLERILKSSSNEGDLILDCFCGSGTTAAVAEKLNRRWITCDLGRFSIHTTRKRLLGIDGVKPFMIQNLGKYERQQWMTAEFTEDTDRMQLEKTYRHFIIELYHGKPLDGYLWLHGSKAGRMIHVGSVEAPVTVEDIKASVKELWKLAGKETEIKKNGIDFLGWDFAFDVNETAMQFANENKVQISFKRIPREVLEKKAVDQGDIRFYELASLTVGTKVAKKSVTVSLENFIIPPDDVPQEVQSAITHWSQWIDYWAIDWDYKDDTFHNMWQNYRTRQDNTLALSTKHTYEQSGNFTILIKVIDILGNDTTKIIKVKL